MKNISHKELLTWLDYNPDTGVFTWKRQPRRRAMEVTSGTLAPEGYILIGLKQVVYKAHRLAWFYVHKKWPTGQIDHIDGKKDNNRISNLREANYSLNQANSKKRSNNKCGFKGVYLHKLSGLYMARVTVNYRSILLGYFKTAEEAHEAYLARAKKHFGNFARAA